MIFLKRMFFNLALSLVLTSKSLALVSKPGDTAIIPKWHIQSSSIAGNDVTKLSKADVDTSAWTQIGSKGTLMGGLVDAAKYSDQDLFFSNNLEKFDASQFSVPWFYRHEFKLNLQKDSYYFLRTNGISSRADVYVNGVLIADKDVQAGAYVGHTFDISAQVKAGANVVLVRVYPTNYLRDFALGFVDWNPYPPDNGTGIWRDVEIRQTGAVSIPGIPKVLTGWMKETANITAKVEVQNHGKSDAKPEVLCIIRNPDGTVLERRSRETQLKASERRTLVFNFRANNPQLWWPKQWGAQPLYSIFCSVAVNNAQSDTTPTRRFGIRTMTSKVDSKTRDITFSINSQPIQILGGGYTSDIFLRFALPKLRSQFQLVLDMGLNTIRLEGKQEHPELYDLADEIGLLVLAGWECCDKWEGWSYNDEGSGQKWVDSDYKIAAESMRHEAEMMQGHPSMLGFLIGSDFWPDDKATKIYVDALKEKDWDLPIISSASTRGFPKQLGPGGMKMEGPYDWVPPNYWYADKLGAAFGFGSELGAGVGTPELPSLKRFLAPADIEDLWQKPNKGLYHMSTKESSFYDRKIYNDALWARYGKPSSLEDYLWKAQMKDYEATRAQFEAFAIRWRASSRPATGLIYWMLNNAWPSLHWNLFDYYLRPAGSYFGAKTALRKEHVAFDYSAKSIYVISRSLSGLAAGTRSVSIELVDLSGAYLANRTVEVPTVAVDSAKKVTDVGDLTSKIQGTALLRLVLSDQNNGTILSRNTYWLSSKAETLDWDASTWFYTPVSSYADYTALNSLKPADVAVSTRKTGEGVTAVLENKSKWPAVFIKLNLAGEEGEELGTWLWDDNYFSLLPGEKAEIYGRGEAAYGKRVEVSGRNVKPSYVPI